MEITSSRSWSRSRLAGIVQRLGRFPRSPVDSPERLHHAAREVAAELDAAGCQVELDPVPFRGGQFENVYGRLPGLRDGPDLVLAAHHDSTPGSPDADALSGLAVLLETARALADSTPERPVLFASYTLGNWGAAGSHHHVSRLRQGGGEVLGMINLDSVGYPNDEGRGPRRTPALLRPFYPRRGGFLSVVGNFASRALARAVARGLRAEPRLRIAAFHLPGRGFLVPEMRSGDHAAFWDAGLKAVMVSDAAVYRNPHHHRSTDRPETLDFAFLERVAAGVAGVVRTILSGHVPALRTARAAAIRPPAAP